MWRVRIIGPAPLPWVNKIADSGVKEISVTDHIYKHLLAHKCVEGLEHYKKKSRTCFCPECGKEHDRKIPYQERAYPGDMFLEWVRKFNDFEHIDKWFAAIREEWSYADWGWHEKDLRDVKMRDTDNKPIVFSVRQYMISTAGWSGNEEIIRAMQDNYLVWGACFFIHRVGGHYIFKVKTKQDGVLIG